MQKVYEGLDTAKLYSVADAIALLKEKISTKFDETIEAAIALGVDTRKSDQNVRGMVELPHGTGKTYRVAVFAKDANAEAAKKAGADVVGSDDLVAAIQKGDLNFDRCIATPDMMGMVGQVAKVLGPKGLMPNPKLGTVTPNVAEAVKKAKAGQVEYRAEKNGIVHAGLGKSSFDVKKLQENFDALLDALKKAKPQGVKGTYLKQVTLSSTMGPGLKLDVKELA